jgi:hypothetical protein
MKDFIKAVLKGLPFGILLCATMLGLVVLLIFVIINYPIVIWIFLGLSMVTYWSWVIGMIILINE